MKRAVAIRLLFRSGILSLFGRAVRWSGVLGLNYHRVGDGSRSHFDRELWSASAEEFDKQVRFLAADFDVVTPRDLPDVLAKKQGRSVMITFDDGYLDNYTVAFPILRRHGVSATFFVSTGFLDNGGLPWWDEIAWMVRTGPAAGLAANDWLPAPVTYDEPDRSKAIRQLLRIYTSLPGDAGQPFLDCLADATGRGRYNQAGERGPWMTWDMIRDMRDAGMVIGGHTVTHPVLARLREDGQEAEIRGCSRRLAAELGEPMLYFSYPVGEHASFNGHTRACLQRVGARYAFSYYGGIRRFDDWDDLDVRRVAVETYMDFDWFRATTIVPGLLARARP